MSDKSIDSILEAFNPGKDLSAQSEDNVTLTLWVPRKYKERFDKLQSRSKREFGKVLREVFKYSIDKVDSDRAS